MKALRIISVILLGILWNVGCDRQKEMMQSFQSIPKDGESNIALDKNVTLFFRTPMNRAVVQNNFHMLTTSKMENIADSMLFYMGSYGMMTQNDSMVIYMDMMRMMTRDGLGGRFTWNADSTQCQFDPDSLMMPNTGYVMHFGSEMMQMMNMMDGDGMMNSNNHGMMDDAGSMMHGDMMTTFFTGTGFTSNHSSHH